MDQLLQDGQEVRTATGGVPCRVERVLGTGGQGEVYSALLDCKKVALKWYYPGFSTPEQKAALEKLVTIGSPSDSFLWPLDLAVSEAAQGFGYVMQLRPAHYNGIVDLLKRRIRPTFRARATCGFGLAESFHRLHASGLCYRDISYNNVFFDPTNGRVLICDNDNVGVEDTPATVLGTDKFMAPEIVLGQSYPGTQTDLHSLAVLLFYLFVEHHPLEGAKEAAVKCWDLPAREKMYGREPLFIFHPTDRSNEPVLGYQDRAINMWPLYPQFLKGLFTRSFTEGLADPLNGRVRETQWKDAMVRLRDSIAPCARCTAENSYDLDAMKASGGQAGTCWSCKSQLRWPFRLRIGKDEVVLLNADTQLYPHHLEGKKYDFSKPIATMNQHPSDANTWGLKNLSNEKWVSTAPDGKVRDVDPGRSVSLASGVRINFGKIEGEVRY